MKSFAPLLVLAAVAVAAPTEGSGPSTSTPQCCQHVENSNAVSSVTKGLIYTLLGIDISALNVPIGTGCAPLSILGGVKWHVQFYMKRPPVLDSDDCFSNQNAVQCGAVAQSALIGINCVPIIINL